VRFNFSVQGSTSDFEIAAKNEARQASGPNNVDQKTADVNIKDNERISFISFAAAAIDIADRRILHTRARTQTSNIHTVLHLRRINNSIVIPEAINSNGHSSTPHATPRHSTIRP
jgi:hypothetical protein